MVSQTSSVVNQTSAVILCPLKQAWSGYKSNYNNNITVQVGSDGTWIIFADKLEICSAFSWCNESSLPIAVNVERHQNWTDFNWIFDYVTYVYAFNKYVVYSCQENGSWLSTTYNKREYAYILCLSASTAATSTLLHFLQLLKLLQRTVEAHRILLV